MEKHIKDFRYEKAMSVSSFVDKLGSIGYQAIHVGKAADIIKRMKKEKATIMLTFTSNMVTSGLRGLFAQLIEMKFVDAVITTAGSIEEDMMKAKGLKFLEGTFDADDLKLGKQGINRIGNIFVPNETYSGFEDIAGPILEQLYQKRKTWVVSDFLRELGNLMDDKNSFIRQAAKNGIPMFCPAITDGALGMQIYFFRQKHPDFILDAAGDMHHLFTATLDANKTGAIILGGGVAKHHAILANLLRGGLDYAVYMTTAHAYAGSLSGATTQEAKSWGKIKGDADAITVIGDVTITFPLVMCKVLDDLQSS